MTLQLVKELRSLRGPLAAAVILVVVVIGLVPWTPGIGLCLAVLYLAGVLVGMELFGSEFTLGTFQMFLVQPVERYRLWRRKLSALAVNLLAIAGTCGLALAFRTLAGHRIALDSSEAWLFPAWLLAGAAVALFWSLFSRQNSGAFWLAITTPGLVVILADQTVGRIWGERVSEGVGQWAVPSLAAALFLGARRLFQTAEELSAARELSLPVFRDRKGPSAPGFLKRTPHSALFRKELRIQQFNVALAGLFAVVLVGLFATAWSGATGKGVVNLYQQDLWILWLLAWSVIPFTVGAISIAEERRLKVHDWCRVFPISPRKQWWVKLSSVLLVSFLLGLLLPVALEVAAFLLLRYFDQSYLDLLWARLLFWFAATCFGFYASSRARNLVQAISIGVLLLAIVGLSLGGISMLALSAAHAYAGSWQSPAAHLLAVALVAASILPVLLVLSYANYRSGSRPVLSDSLVFAACLVLSAVTALGLSVRAWDRLAAERAPSAPLPPVAGVLPTVAASWSRVLVLTPDSHLWVYDPLNQEATPIPGTNWATVQASETIVCALKTDGTLWSWMRSPGQRGVPPPLFPELRQVGTEGDWVQVAVGLQHAVALKRDGTLWGWGENDLGQLGTGDEARRSEPTRIGTTNRWTAVAAGFQETIAADIGGSIWRWGYRNDGRSHSQGEKAVRSHLDPGVRWTALWMSGLFAYGLDSAGGGWFIGRPNTWNPEADRARPEMTRLSGEAWRDVAAHYGTVIWINVRSELLRCNSRYAVPLPEELQDPDHSRRVGTRSDWVAVGGSAGPWDQWFGLTVDGVLWMKGRIPDDTSSLRLIPESQRPRPIAVLRAAAR